MGEMPLGAEAFGPSPEIPTDSVTDTAADTLAGGSHDLRPGRTFRGGPFGDLRRNDADIEEALFEEDPFLNIGSKSSGRPPRLPRAGMGVWVLI
jgi:hypothetical protein